MEVAPARPVPGARSVPPGNEYSSAAKWFHWLTVPALGIALLSGMTIRFIVDDTKMAFYALHESLGLLLLALAVLRLGWRLRHPPPALAAHLPRAIRIVADGVHLALYTLLIVQPVLGFFTTNAYGFPQQGDTAFLGLIDLPAFMDARPDLALQLHWGHSILGWLLAVLIGVHVAGTVYHHAWQKDGTLLRML